MKCDVCGRTMILKNKMIDGYICDKCLFALPYALNQATISNVKELLAHEPQRPFSATMNYGHLYVDENSMQFLIKEPIKNGKTTSKYIFDLSKVHQLEMIYKGNPSGNQFANGDVILTVGLTNPRITMKTVIKKNVKSPLLLKDNNVVTWMEPEDLLFFKKQLSSIVNNYIQNSCISENRINELERAKIAFYLDDGYKESDIKAQRNRLLKVFHQDGGTVEEQRYAQMINYYYEILTNSLEGI